MFLFLGCLVSSVLKILYLFLYAIFKVHVRYGSLKSLSVRIQWRWRDSNP